MADDRAGLTDAERRHAERLWKAGEFTRCGQGSTHAVSNVHVIVRCACGASYMSTDATIALGMAQQHESKR